MDPAAPSEADLNKERLELALEAAGLDLWENDLVTGHVTRKASKTFEELGFTEEEIVSDGQGIYALFHPDDLDAVRQAVADHIAGSTPQYRCEFRLCAKSGQWVWYANYGRIMDAEAGAAATAIAHGHASGNASADAPPRGRRLIGVTFNIDDRKRREDEIAQVNCQLTEQNHLLQQLNATLEQLAGHDALTGLANRRALMELGAGESRRAARYGHALSVLMVDIDQFKPVNDAWGHLAGDRVICAVAAACAAHRRAGIDFVARFGGEEFVVVLPATDGDAALQVAHALRSAVAALSVPVNAHRVHLSVTVSIGVATVRSGEAADFEELLNRADGALYRAKQAGRNTVRCAEPQGAGAAPLQHVLPLTLPMPGAPLAAGWPSSV